MKKNCSLVRVYTVCSGQIFRTDMIYRLQRKLNILLQGKYFPSLSVWAGFKGKNMPNFERVKETTSCLQNYQIDN